MKETGEYKYHHLVDPISKGDQKAFTALYDLFYPSLAQHILQKLDNETVMQDILHDLFLSIWKNREKLQEIDSLPGYLYSSCRYLVLAHIRRSTLVQYSDNVYNLDFQITNESLEDRLYYRYLIDIVNAEIEKLPTKCKHIFKLSREQHLSNKEIADRLGLSESTVENHINRAIKQLRGVIQHYLFLFFFL
jgi:RNA polymerase sigma-70 factor (ECF subfamily)